jgi:hypothetical protein
MCTVSVALSRDGSALRLLMNRDERRLRLGARPPALTTRGATRAVWPIDQHAGGTWIAMNEAGLAFALLNATTRGKLPAGPAAISRGAVIPSLIGARDIDEVERRFINGPASWPCLPFTLVVATRDRVTVLTPNGSTAAEMPVVFSSSTLGDDLVDGPRRDLFDHLLATSASAWEAQTRLHQHAWPDRRHLSVLMSRADACTVSRTEIIVSSDRCTMQYAAILDGWPAGVTPGAVTLDRRREAAAA